MVNNRQHEENSQSIDTVAREEKVSELEILQQSLEEKKRQAEGYYEQMLRLRADFENYRKRSEKEKQNHLVWGKEEILLKQVSLLDVLEQALQSIKSSTSIESVQKGLELINQEFKKMLSSEGVTEIEGPGKPFDPSVHEAIEQVKSDQPEGTIVDVAQKGYMLNGRVIRPARVKVAKQENKESKKE